MEPFPGSVGAFRHIPAGPGFGRCSQSCPWNQGCLSEPSRSATAGGREDQSCPPAAQPRGSGEGWAGHPGGAAAGQGLTGELGAAPSSLNIPRRTRSRPCLHGHNRTHSRAWCPSPPRAGPCLFLQPFLLPLLTQPRTLRHAQLQAVPPSPLLVFFFLPRMLSSSQQTPPPPPPPPPRPS